MNRYNAISAIAATAITLGAIMFAFYNTSEFGDRYLHPIEPGLNQIYEGKAIYRNNYFFEDFENPTPDTELPEGWISMNTEGVADDCWKVGAVEESSYSGCRCAYVEGGKKNTPHDSWFFSPVIHISEPVLFADFFVLMPAINNDRIKSRLCLYLCSAQQPDSIVTEFETLEFISVAWVKVMRPLSKLDGPGDYCLAFRCISPANANTLCLDDVRVSDGCDSGLALYKYNSTWISLCNSMDHSAALR